MPEELIVQHCAPTLAGMKTGNLFSCPYASAELVLEDVRQLNRRLVPKGLCALPLHFTDGRALIYLYRPGSLKKDLANSFAKKLLRERGYAIENPCYCVAQLVERFAGYTEFPHEIGLFLGYPPEDVHGFIENQSACAKCVGDWKVYGDEKAAKRLFKKYKKCTEAYCAQWDKNQSIERLIVAV